MRIKTTETKVYKFEELTEKQKAKAIEKLYDINVNYDWWQCVYEDAGQIGLKITRFDIDRGAFCEGDFLLSAVEVAQNILNNHGEKTETYKTSQSFMEEWQPIYNDYLDEKSDNYESEESEDKLQEIEDEFLKSLLEDYRIMFSKEYNYLTSEEAIIETIQANDYEFDEEGNLA
jgi:myo-inositol catabolism protein IolC